MEGSRTLGFWSQGLNQGPKPWTLMPVLKSYFAAAKHKNSGKACVYDGCDLHREIVLGSCRKVSRKGFR